MLICIVYNFFFTKRQIYMASSSTSCHSIVYVEQTFHVFLSVLQNFCIDFHLKVAVNARDTRSGNGEVWEWAALKPWHWTVTFLPGSRVRTYLLVLCLPHSHANIPIPSESGIICGLLPALHVWFGCFTCASFPLTHATNSLSFLPSFRREQWRVRTVVQMLVKVAKTSLHYTCPAVNTVTTTSSLFSFAN